MLHTENITNLMNHFSFQRIWSHLLKKSLIENFIFCAVFTIGWKPKKRKAILFNNSLTIRSNHWNYIFI